MEMDLDTLTTENLTKDDQDIEFVDSESISVVNSLSSPSVYSETTASVFSATTEDLTESDFNAMIDSLPTDPDPSNCALRATTEDIAQYDYISAIDSLLVNPDFSKSGSNSANCNSPTDSFFVAPTEDLAHFNHDFGFTDLDLAGFLDDAMALNGSDLVDPQSNSAIVSLPTEPDTEPPAFNPRMPTCELIEVNPTSTSRFSDPMPAPIAQPFASMTGVAAETLVSTASQPILPVRRRRGRGRPRLDLTEAERRERMKKQRMDRQSRKETPEISREKRDIGVDAGK